MDSSHGCWLALAALPASVKAKQACQEAASCCIRHRSRAAVSARYRRRGKADGALAWRSRYSHGRRMMSSDAQVAARMRPNRHARPDLNPRDSPKRVGPITSS